MRSPGRVFHATSFNVDTLTAISTSHFSFNSAKLHLKTTPNPITSNQPPNTNPKTYFTMHGNGGQTKVHFKGEGDDFVIFVDSAQAVRDWKADKSVPLAQVVNGWKIFVTHKSVISFIMVLLSGSNVQSGTETKANLTPHPTASSPTSWVPTRRRMLLLKSSRRETFSSLRYVSWDGRDSQ